MSFTRGKIVFATAIAAIWLAAHTANAADDWQAGGGEKWQTVLAAAKKEGKVVVAGHPSIAQILPETFKRDTGIELEFIAGNTRDISARFNTEARSNNIITDLILSGGAQFPLMETGHLEAIKPQLILPGSSDGPQWSGGKVKWMDASGQYMLQGASFLSVYALVDTRVIDPSQVKSWSYFLKPEFKGKIIAYDPRSGGPGQAVASYLADVFGIEFVKKLYIGQEVKYTRDGRQMVEQVVRGVHPIALGGSAPDIDIFKKQGIKNLGIVMPDDAPGATVGGFSVLKQVKGAPHPNASTVFINWYASQRGQQIYTNAMQEPSLRTDVDLSAVPEYAVPKAGLKYVDQYFEPWYLTVRTRVEKDVVDALGGR